MISNELAIQSLGIIMDNYFYHLPKIGFRAITTNIFNDYIVDLPHHALESWVCRGPKSTDKALTAR